MTARRNPSRTTLLLLVASLLGLVSACGGQPRQVSGELPLVQLDGLALVDALVQLDIGIRNVNDRPLELSQVVLLLELDDGPVTQRTPHRFDLNVSARGREVIRLESDIDERGQRLLEELSAGERNSLAYRLELEFDGQRRRQRQRQLDDTIARGFLHPVPGQPGRFR